MGAGEPHDAAPLSHPRKSRHERLRQREETHLKISLSKVKLTFEQQSHPFQGREKQRNKIFTALLRVGIYAKLQKCWGAICSHGTKVFGSAQLLCAGRGGIGSASRAVQTALLTALAMFHLDMRERF